jgi:hypothetical protein
MAPDFVAEGLPAAVKTIRNMLTKEKKENP